MEIISRRDSLRYITLASLSGALFACETNNSPAEHKHELSEDIKKLSPEDRELLNKKFFTDTERELIKTLANIIIPADERSGNAEEAKTVDFIEFVVLDQPKDYETKMRGGIRWIEIESWKRFGKNFVTCNDTEKFQLLDDIAYPDIAKPEMSHGVSFFNMLRGLVLTGFFTSKIGMQDLQYMGNRANIWKGAPDEWLKKLGVSYE